MLPTPFGAIVAPEDFPYGESRLKRVHQPGFQYYSDRDGTMTESDSLQQAKETLKVVSQGEQRRPLFVEFSGTPKSGKSNRIDIVTHFFRRAGYKILAPSEGASKRTPYYLKEDWVAFNTWSASYALMHVLEGLHSSDKYDFAILDRGSFDALAWFELLKIRGEITEEKRDQVHNFLYIDNWRSLIDLVLLFSTDPETSWNERIVIS